MADAAADQVLDTKGLNCPLPVLKAKKALKGLPVGGVLHILATDPGATGDFDAFCKSTGHTMIETGEADGVYSFVIRKEA